MEIETLFSSTRWEILKALSKQELSPMELATQINTTSANISQQLRLLELGGLVKSEKTQNVDKGKPRVVYSLAGDNAFLIFSAPHFAEKKLISLTQYHKFIMKTWFLDNQDHHALLAEFYHEVKDQLGEISVIAVQSSARDMVVYVVPDSKKSGNINLKGSLSKKVRVNTVDLAELRKKSSLVVLYDPSRIVYSEVVE